MSMRHCVPDYCFCPDMGGFTRFKSVTNPAARPREDKDVCIMKCLGLSPKVTIWQTASYTVW
jgi:hypothetical protein